MCLNLVFPFIYPLLWVIRKIGSILSMIYAIKRQPEKLSSYIKGARLFLMVNAQVWMPNVISFNRVSPWHCCSLINFVRHIQCCLSYATTTTVYYVLLAFKQFRLIHIRVIFHHTTVSSLLLCSLFTPISILTTLLSSWFYLSLSLSHSPIQIDFRLYASVFIRMPATRHSIQFHFARK